VYLQGVQIVDICSYLGRIKTQPLWCVWALAGSQLLKYPPMQTLAYLQPLPAAQGLS
jgi:hypothetical protein